MSLEFMEEDLPRLAIYTTALVSQA